MLSVILLNAIYAECLKYALYAQFHYAKFCHAECRYAECRGAFQTRGPSVSTEKKFFKNRRPFQRRSSGRKLSS